MATKKRVTKPRTVRKKTPSAAPRAAPDVDAVIASLKGLATKHTRDGMTRYGIPNDNALGVTVGDMQRLAKSIGKNHALAAALWETGVYEARMLATFIDEPAAVTPAQMDRWCKDFDSWAICDTACLHLFDRTPHAYKKILKWSSSREEFVKRAAFALLAAVALHDKAAGDEPFTKCLPLIESAAPDERNFVKKGVNWALRAVGERNPALHAAAVRVAKRLSESESAAARWVGRDALRQLAKRAAMKAKRRSRTRSSAP